MLSNINNMTQTTRDQIRSEFYSIIEKYADIDQVVELAIDDLIATLDPEQDEDPYNAVLSPAEKRQIAREVESSINYENF